MNYMLTHSLCTGVAIILFPPPNAPSVAPTYDSNNCDLE